MKTVKASLIFLLFLSVNIFAGNEGGGGYAVVCRDNQNEITNVKMLDLYEAEYAYQVNVWNKSNDTKAIVNEAFNKLNNSMDQADVHLLPIVNRIYKIARFVPKVAKPATIDDVDPIIIPTECSMEQVALYVNDELLLIDLEVWEMMDNTNKAALYIHEAVYRLERYSGAKSSRRARKVVAHTFSDHVLENLREGIPGDAIWCQAFDNKENQGLSYTFAIWKTKSRLSKVQFTRFQGQALYSKKYAIIPWQVGTPIPIRGNGNFTGGTYYSNFENSGSFTLGVEYLTNSSGTDEQFYITDENGKNYLSDCF